MAQRNGHRGQSGGGSPSYSTYWFGAMSMIFSRPEGSRRAIWACGRMCACMANRGGPTRRRLRGCEVASVAAGTVQNSCNGQVGLRSRCCGSPRQSATRRGRRRHRNIPSLALPLRMPNSTPPLSLPPLYSPPAPFPLRPPSNLLCLPRAPRQHHTQPAAHHGTAAAR